MTFIKLKESIRLKKTLKKNIQEMTFAKQLKTGENLMSSRR